MKRLEQSLNKPTVVLVVGVIAMALNVLLYFGYFLPRTTPLVEQIYSIGTSLPEAIGKSDSKTGSKSDPETGVADDVWWSDSGRGSDPEASGTTGSETRRIRVAESVSDSSSASSPNPPSDSPSGSAAEAAGTSSSRLCRLSHLPAHLLLSFRLYLLLLTCSINKPR